jgi:thiol:disulfide interchange protein DsbD
MNPSGSPVDYLAAFLGGVAVSFTPCVYPLIPVSVGIIANRGSSRVKAFTLSLTFVTGVAAVYSLLGLAASLTGTIFGSISAHPATQIAVGALIAVFGFSMLGLFHIQVNPRAIRVISDRGGYLSVFFLGAASAFVLSPCLTPVLGSLLSYLATGKNILYGMTLLAAFAYGMGLILILCGTFAGLLASLPKSGKWMDYVKKASGAALLFAGAYFIINGIRRF